MAVIHFVGGEILTVDESEEQIEKWVEGGWVPAEDDGINWDYGYQVPPKTWIRVHAIGPTDAAQKTNCIRVQVKNIAYYR